MAFIANILSLSRLLPSTTKRYQQLGRFDQCHPQMSSCDRFDEDDPTLTFLDRLRSLPTKLCNQIYEELAKDDRLIVRQQDQGHSCSVNSHYLSRLDNVDQQILQEYTSLAIEIALEIETTFNDIDFAHVEKFLECLSEKEIPTSGKFTKASVHHQDREE